MPVPCPLAASTISRPSFVLGLGPGLLALSLAALGAWSTPRVALAQWTDMTTPALADTVWIVDKKGVAFVDFDGDGDLDISVVGEGPHVGSLFRNDGGVFTEVTSGSLLIGGSASGQTWGDYDNDGDLDEFVDTEEQPQRLLRNDGNGVFTDITSGILADRAHGHSTAWVDYDRDGLLDLYIAFFNTPSKLLHNIGGGALVDVTADSLGVTSADGVAWGDYDNDGDPDLYISRFAWWPNVMMRNDGALGFTNVTTPVLAVTNNTHSVAATDYDNDGDLDLYMCVSLQPNHLLRNDGSFLFTDVTTPNLALGYHSRSPCWGDFDNDGWLDLFVTESLQDYTLIDGVNHLFHNNGNGSFTEITPPVLLGSGENDGAAAGDYDGDGDLDLYVSSYALPHTPERIQRPNQLFRNDLANGNHWIELDLTGVVSNRSAIGARVTLTAGGMTQMGEVQGCTGFRSKSALTVHFGLGSATHVDRIRIRWPSGIIQDTTLASVDHRFKMVERDNTVGVPVGPPGVSGVALASAMPNPVIESTQFDVTLPAAGPVRLAIIDAQGRTVRVLERGVLPAGSHRSTWDGRDAGGARVPGGIYWCVLEAARARTSRRLAVVR